MVTLKLDGAPWIDIGIAVVNSCFADSHWHFAELLEQIIKVVQVSRFFLLTPVSAHGQSGIPDYSFYFTFFEIFSLRSSRKDGLVELGCLDRKRFEAGLVARFV